ncbi:hypothetical protein IK110_03515 [Candidatus Saccharibacteria bacterium]|nr:hypothetical protein [Candidatus Saccharibacteria bacterium]
MVCIAAFIILCLMSVIVAFLSIFRRDIGKRWWKTFKKAWGCVGKRITLQKCETGFKEDIKTSILAKVIVKKPKLVKPISAAIEVVAVLIVLVTAWSLVEGVKAGLALWSLGTCNVQRPEACAFGAEACSIDGDSGPKNPIEAVGYWFADWGEIFSAIPDKFRDWNNEKLELSGVLSFANTDNQTPLAIDILDPGCSVCLQSFREQIADDFFGHYNVLLVPFPIQDGDGSYKFANSKIISEYVLAATMQGVPDGYKGERTPAFDIMKRIFTEKNDEKKNWQTIFNNYYSNEEAEAELLKWLAEFGYNTEEVKRIKERTTSDEVAQMIAKNNDIVVNNIHAKGIPTMIYNGKKHTGAYKK